MEPALTLNWEFDHNHAARMLLDLAQEHSVEALLSKLVAGAASRPEIACIQVWLVDKASGALRLAAAEGRLSPELSMFMDPAAAGMGLLERIVATGHTILMRELDEDWPQLGDRARLIHSGIRGFSGTPIAFKGEVLGVMAVYLRIAIPENPLPWNRIFGDYLGAAFANARAFEEIRRLQTQLEQQNAYLQEEVLEARAFGDLVGQSAGLSQVVNQIDLVAPTDASVLILGETGTGKELVAYEIHRRSRRHDKPLVRVNCASVPKDLYESEFFGHAKGAFTGAIRDRAGRFETAEGGTLLLDEIAEVPLELQGKLLRVLQEKCYERVGEDQTQKADVRIIAATNRDLKRAVETGHFREDLYYRLNVFPIQVMPLRERQEDIAPLAHHFVAQTVNSLRCPKPRLTPAGIVQLQSYDWPGNVRELRNVIERAVILARGGVIEFDLPLGTAPPTATAPATRAAGQPPGFLTEVELRQRERANLLAVLEHCNWKIKGPAGAAERLGVKASTLLSRLKTMGLRRPQ